MFWYVIFLLVGAGFLGCPGPLPTLLFAPSMVGGSWSIANFCKECDRIAEATLTEQT